MDRIIKKINTALFKELSLADRKNIYYINIKAETAGFFGLLRCVLDWVCYADEMGYTPYVVYDPTSLYTEKKPLKGTRNVFEYYFRQIYNENKIRMPWRINLIQAEGSHLYGLECRYNDSQFSYYVEDNYISRMAYIYEKYIKLTSDTEKYIKKAVKKKLGGKKTLGIHIRGTDFNKVFDNHPIPVSVDDYVSAINAIFDKYSFEQVFVATDDIRCLDELQNKLSVPVVYYEDAVRSDVDKSVAFMGHTRKNDRYLLGLEVLRDAYTLSYCAGFIGCLSQVDIFVQIIKKSRGKNFVYKKIIDCGVSNTGKMCWEPKE